MYDPPTPVHIENDVLQLDFLTWLRLDVVRLVGEDGQTFAPQAVLYMCGDVSSKVPLSKLAGMKINWMLPCRNLNAIGTTPAACSVAAPETPIRSGSSSKAHLKCRICPAENALPAILYS